MPRVPCHSFSIVTTNTTTPSTITTITTTNDDDGDGSGDGDNNGGGNNDEDGCDCEEDEVMNDDCIVVAALMIMDRSDALSKKRVENMFILETGNHFLILWTARRGGYGRGKFRDVVFKIH